MTTTAPDRSKRDECWKARDQLFACLEGHTLEQERDMSTCEQLRRLLKETCPASWESHFVRKHLNERRRKQELQSMGAKDINQAIKDGDVQYPENPRLIQGGGSVSGMLKFNVLCESHWLTSFKRFIRRGRVPSKHGNAEYYKGTGTGSMGRHHQSFYVIDPAKVRDFVIPSLSKCKLRPYVAATTDRRQSREIAPKNVQDYIDQATGPSLQNKSKKTIAPKVVVEPAPLSDL